MDLRHTVDGVVNISCCLSAAVCHRCQVVVVVVNIACDPLSRPVYGGDIFLFVLTDRRDLPFRIGGRCQVIDQVPCIASGVTQDIHTARHVSMDIIDIGNCSKFLWTTA